MPDNNTIRRRSTDSKDPQMQRMRIALGVLGIALPIVDYFLTVVIGGWDWRVPSISSTYYGPGGTPFVMLMGAMSLLLINYRGYDIKDHILTTIAGIGGLVLALFPCEYNAITYNFLMLDYKISNVIHLVGALSLFVCFFIIIFFQFTITANFTRKKGQRNLLYRICGIVIAVSLVLGFTIPITGAVYIGETLALWAFGLAWIVKGQLLLKDNN